MQDFARAAPLRRRAAAARPPQGAAPLPRRATPAAARGRAPCHWHAPNTHKHTQLGAALAVVGVTAVHMAGADVTNARAIWGALTGTCLLSAGGAVAVCYYAYALGIVSIIFTLAIGLMQV